MWLRVLLCADVHWVSRFHSKEEGPVNWIPPVGPVRWVLDFSWTDWPRSIDVPILSSHYYCSFRLFLVTRSTCPGVHTTEGSIMYQGSCRPIWDTLCGVRARLCFHQPTEVLQIGEGLTSILACIPKSSGSVGGHWDSCRPTEALWVGDGLIHALVCLLSSYRCGGGEQSSHWLLNSSRC